MLPDNQMLMNALAAVRQGGIIAYPTEAVYGLGCDPFNEQAVTKLLQIKQRPVEKGLILIASDWSQFRNLIHVPDQKLLQKVDATWPGPVTWCFPATDAVPYWIRGNYSTVAIRMTNHPIAKALCNALNSVLVSTSANIATEEPSCTAQEVAKVFGNKIDYIVPGEVGSLERPTAILDVITSEIIRS